MVTPVGANVIEHRNLTACTPCFGMDKCPLGFLVFETLRWTGVSLAFIDESFTCTQGDTRSSILFKDN